MIVRRESCYRHLGVKTSSGFKESNNSLAVFFKSVHVHTFFLTQLHLRESKRWYECNSSNYRLLVPMSRDDHCNIYPSL